MPFLRLATLDDMALITRQRHLMFADNGFGTPESLAAMDVESAAWLRRHLAAETYLGLLLSEEEGGEVLAACGIWLQDWPPHYLQHEPLRAYLLNFYTAPEARGRGYAKLLLDAAVNLSRDRGAKVITLHASRFGRPIYEAYGFKQSNELMLKSSASRERVSGEAGSASR